MMDKKKAIQSKLGKGAGPKKISAKKMPVGSAKQAGTAGRQMPTKGGAPASPKPKKRPMAGVLSKGLK